jgi:hypothetical protein
MGIKETVSNAVMDKRSLIAVLVIAILWRLGISLDGQIALWESLCSGIALFIMGWSVFAYIYLMSRELKGWLRLCKIYQWIAFCLMAINTYVIVYYGMRWYRLAGVKGVVEAVVPQDFLYNMVNEISDGDAQGLSIGS